ncbi:hypothetical protein LZ198_03075 [Myxococcus sp. K15C18031901]|uniref:hypothetical protein n=1 Tax=Myxococcus dinghuensis TaxID=2906761 RepID=UPI0020A6F6AE|nr:hypothetical protein [Myxococcus dinghuensis]MCP3097853.1 hypothetical protein [Myxococcus dinghuensis]
MKRSLPWMLAGVVGLWMGCGGPPEEQGQEGAPEEQEGLISQTILRQLPDGTVTQETRYITPEERQAQFDAREEYARRLRSGMPQQMMESLVIDDGCAGSSLWLFDQPNRLGRQLCLYKNPVDTYAFINLGSIIRYIVPGSPLPRIYTWTAAVRSLWSGVDAGNLATCDTTRMACYSNAPYLAFGTYQQLNDLSFPQLPGTPTGPNTVFLEN